MTKKPKIENKGAELAKPGNPAWVKGGASPNPGGRSLEAREMVEAFRKSGPDFVKQIETLCSQGNVEALKLAMAYAYGKPSQSIKLDGDVTLSLSQLVIASMKGAK